MQTLLALVAKSAVTSYTLPATERITAGHARGTLDRPTAQVLSVHRPAPAVNVPCQEGFSRPRSNDPSGTNV
jgi:hypothetical protein